MKAYCRLKKKKKVEGHFKKFLNYFMHIKNRDNGLLYFSLKTCYLSETRLIT